MKKGLFLLIMALFLISSVQFNVVASPEEMPFVGAWPYEMPPRGHNNSFVTGALNFGIYVDMRIEPLAWYIWHNNTYIPVLATKYYYSDAKDYFIVELRQGVKFHDGHTLTSADVIATFYTGWIQKWAVWTYIDKVEADGDYKVKFHIKKPSIMMERFVLRTNIRDAPTYGNWSDAARRLIEEGKGWGTEEQKDLAAKFAAFRPKSYIGTGPFILQSLTEEVAVFKFFDEYWNKDRIKFRSLELYNGETPTITPYVLGGFVDYATHGFPPATEKQFLAQEWIRVIRPPIRSGPAIYFNHKIYPLNLKEVRQAIAYAIDRKANGYASLLESGVGVEKPYGFSETMGPLWIPAAELEAMNSYEYNISKAISLLTGLGFRRGADGVWVTPNGTRLEYELIFPAEYVDWAAAAEHAANQLTAFGIKITLRGVSFTIYLTQYLYPGDFQMMIASWGATNPFPYESYYTPFIARNSEKLGMGPGMRFPEVVYVERLGKNINITDHIIKSIEGFDTTVHKRLYTELAWMFNEYLPILPLWERYGNNPANLRDRVIWLSFADPIYTNPPYADPFIIILIMQGLVRSKAWVEVGTYEASVLDVKTGKGIPAVRVAFSGPTTKTVYTDENGRFVATDLKPGSYTVTLTREGYEQATFSVNIPIGITKGPDISLTTRPPPTPWELYGAVIAILLLVAYIAYDKLIKKKT